MVGLWRNCTGLFCVYQAAAAYGVVALFNPTQHSPPHRAAKSGRARLIPKNPRSVVYPAKRTTRRFSDATPPYQSSTSAGSVEFRQDTPPPRSPDESPPPIKAYAPQRRQFRLTWPSSLKITPPSGALPNAEPPSTHRPRLSAWRVVAPHMPSYFNLGGQSITLVPGYTLASGHCWIPFRHTELRQAKPPDIKTHSFLMTRHQPSEDPAPPPLLSAVARIDDKKSSRNRLSVFRTRGWWPPLPQVNRTIARWTYETSPSNGDQPRGGCCGVASSIN